MKMKDVDTAQSCLLSKKKTSRCRKVLEVRGLIVRVKGLSSRRPIRTRASRVVWIDPAKLPRLPHDLRSPLCFSELLARLHRRRVGDRRWSHVNARRRADVHRRRRHDQSCDEGVQCVHTTPPAANFRIVVASKRMTFLAASAALPLHSSVSDSTVPVPCSLFR
jgi:hypothetical protein